MHVCLLLLDKCMDSVLLFLFDKCVYPMKSPRNDLWGLIENNDNYKGITGKEYNELHKSIINAKKNICV